MAVVGMASFVLQWGRSVNAAETWAGRSHPLARASFNGAAALTLRKHEEEEEDEDEEEASMGPQR